MRASQLLQKRIRYGRNIRVTVTEAFNLPSEEPGKPNDGTARLHFRGGFFFPKDLGKLPLPKATHSSDSKTTEGKKVNLDVSVLLSKWWLRKFNR